MLAFAGARSARFVARAALALTLVLGQLGMGMRPGMAQSQQLSGEVVLKSPQAIVIDAESGAVLFQRNADELTPPGSMSKLMLLVIMFLALKSGELNADTEFLMSEHAWR